MAHVGRIRYREDKPGKVTPYPGSPYLPFGAFALSSRMQGLTLKIARDGALIAKMLSPKGEGSGPHYRDQFATKPGEIVTIDGLPRVTSEIVNNDPKAAAVEFGSGEGSVGDSSGEGRPQGGHSPAHRVLGKTGRILGDFHE